MTAESGRGEHRRGQARSPVRRVWLLGGVVAAAVVVALLLMSGRGAAPAAESSPPLTGPLVAPTAPPAPGREVFAAPGGLPTNPGTREAPDDLATALSSNTPASPGDVIWLRAGLYVGNFTSALKGTAVAPYQVRQYPGERATLAAAALDTPALAVDGSWTWFRDFEITLAPPGRRTPPDPPEAIDLRTSGGVVIRGSHIAVVSLVIHDMPRGIAVTAGAAAPLIAGNLVYHSGWKDSYNAVGVQFSGVTGDQYLVDNIVFANGGNGVSANLNGGSRLLVEGNVVFDSGVVGDTFARNLEIAGGTMEVVGNYTYYSPGRRGGENHFGYGSVGCERIDARRNYWAHHRVYPAAMGKCDGAFDGNTMIGSVDPSFIKRYPANTYVSQDPTGLDSFVQRNRYEPGRAHVVVFNWDGHPAVNVDVAAAALASGASYEVRDALDYFAPPVAAGTFAGGRLNIPMTGLKEAPVTGHLAVVLGHTAPRFGVFVLTSTTDAATSASPSRESAVPR